MGKSYRIPTQVGVNKQINLQLEQDFEFLEILSLQIGQSQIYSRDCSQYGLLVGRVVANGGLGIANAKITVFVPITEQDTTNDVISDVYNYSLPNNENTDGYKFNVLPYEPSYPNHAATGTFPSRGDVLKDPTASELYKKYYKYTVTTNESGDYMIMGVPLGDQVIVMNLDLSDIGEFSLTPQDLIRIGRATPEQVGGERFNSSVDFETLPQIVVLDKTVEISPFWGDPNQCLAAVNRVDFDLREDANIEIEPTSVFIGSIISTIDKFRIAAPFFGTDGPPGMIQAACKPKDNLGNLCNLTSGPGQILAIRQTIFQDDEGRPILEQYRLPNSGNVIDGDGTWVTEIPMNLDYVVTAEDGTRVLSNNPKIGVPTRAKYRFKIKWSQGPVSTEKIRRPYYLVPNVKEYGWTSSIDDPNYYDETSIVGQELRSSYYFGLDWSGYTQGRTTQIQNQRLQNAINCEDTFYEFDYNKIYTVSSLIDQYKRGNNRARFIGIKEIDDDDCASTVNKFPVNEGFKNFDLIYFLFSILFQVFQLIGPIFLVVYYLIAYVWNNLVSSRPNSAIAVLLYLLYGLSVVFFAAAATSFPAIGLIITFVIAGAAMLVLAIRASVNIKQIKEFRFGPLRFAQITYPECSTCDCKPGDTKEGAGGVPSSILTPVANSGVYFDGIYNAPRFTPPPPSAGYRNGDPNFYWFHEDGKTNDPFSDANKSSLSFVMSQAMGTRAQQVQRIYEFKSTESEISRLPDVTNLLGIPRKIFANSTQIPLGNRINIFNGRKKYFDQTNRISVSFDNPSNSTIEHYDNSLTILSQQNFESGTLLTFVNPGSTSDVNYLYTAQTVDGSYVTGISGTTLFPTAGSFPVTYANTQLTNSTVTYFLSSGSTETNYKYPSDIEYFQVVTAITVSDAFNLLSNLGCNTCQKYSVETDFDLNNQITISISYDDCEEGPKTISLSSTFDPFDLKWIPEIIDICSCTPPVITGQGSATLISSCSVTPNYNGFLGLLNSSVQVFFNRNNATGLGWKDQVSETFRYRDIIQNYGGQYVLVLQRGVDPYSPKYQNKYGLGKLFGFGSENDIEVIASTRTNIPIQALPNSTISVQGYGQSDIFNQSKFFRAGDGYSAFTTFNVGYYSALDKNTNFTSFKFTESNGVPSNFGYVSSMFSRPTLGGVGSLISINGNNAYSVNPSFANYDASEDISGADYYYTKNNNNPNNAESLYLSFSLIPRYTGSPLNMSSKLLNVMRTDRLPTSDFLDGTSWESVTPLLQQNNGFAIYELSTDGEDFDTVSYSGGFESTPPDIEDLPASTNVLETFDCANMVSLQCYSGDGVTFGVKSDCIETDNVERGCYVFMKDGPQLTGGYLQRDIIAFTEWGVRFRFFYSLCRGVLSQTFTNNWINGTLFTIPIQTRAIYNSKNELENFLFCKEMVYFDNDSNNFYMRSSPWNPVQNKFIGKLPTPIGASGAINSRNLLYPTTLLNMGVKNVIFSQIGLDPSDRGYVVNKLTPSSYGDTSDIVNLFVVSRISNNSFLKNLVTIGDPNAVVNQLFSRPERRADGDLVQAFSINSEFGVIKFSPDAYESTGNTSTDPVRVLGSGVNSVMGIFFSSTTEDLQGKDFISPGRINFRPNPSANAFLYTYGIKSQTVPFYKWGLNQPAGLTNIFGGQLNNWQTQPNDIFGYKYQSLDRTNISQPSYFIGSNSFVNERNARGYIFNVDNSGNLNVSSGVWPPKFLVGAPNHFYFGLINGKSALDKFKEIYIGDE